MVKVTLNNICTGTAFQTAIPTVNSNNDTIETAFDNTISRDGTSPNTMLSNFDMNSYAILNLPMATDPTSPVRLQEIGDAPGYSASAAASAASASASASSASTSASTATTQAGIATTQANNASTSASSASASAATSTANATVVEGNEYSFATSTTMADPGTGLLRFNNATPTSATAIAISALTNASGNPNIRTFIASWDDSTNTIRGSLLIRKIGTPATFVVYSISGALTDNTTWLQLAVTGVTGNGTFSASDRLSVQFVRYGDAGAMSGPGVSVDSEIAVYNGTTGTALKRATTTGILKGTSGVISAAVSGTDYAPATTGSALLKANGAGGFSTPGTGDTLTIGTIELGNASDTTLSRGAAGILAVEGINVTATVPVSSQSAAYTAVLADQNTTILHPAADNNARTFTIPANASVAYPVGTTLTFVNEINTVTISINTDTLTQTGTGSTGSRTLAANGMATAYKITSTKWVISGTGLT